MFGRRKRTEPQQLQVPPTEDDNPKLKGWRIEAMDVTKRWDRVSSSDIRTGLAIENVLIHHWHDQDDLSYEEVIAVLQNCLDYGIFEGDDCKYKGAPLRIANKDGDFMPIEILSIKVTRKDKKTKMKEMMEKAMQAQMAGAAKAASPLTPIKKAVPMPQHAPRGGGFA